MSSAIKTNDIVSTAFNIAIARAVQLFRFGQLLDGTIRVLWSFLKGMDQEVE